MVCRPWELKDWREKRENIIKNHKCCQLCGSKKKPLVLHHNTKRGSLTDEKYKELDTKHVLVICKKCHYRIHMGCHMCPSCSKWIKSRYSLCYNCFQIQKKMTEEDAPDIGEPY